MLEPLHSLEVETFEDMFSLRLSRSSGDCTVLDRLAALYEEVEKASLDEMSTSGRFPRPFSASVEFSGQTEDGRISLKVEVRVKWRIYEGRTEAHLLQGSYSFTSGEFLGEQMSPVIDLMGPDPGPGWELLKTPPVKINLATRHFCKQASGGILSPSKEPPRAPFDKLRVLATARNTATFRKCMVARR